MSKDARDDLFEAAADEIDRHIVELQVMYAFYGDVVSAAIDNWTTEEAQPILRHVDRVLSPDVFPDAADAQHSIRQALASTAFLRRNLLSWNAVRLKLIASSAAPQQSQPQGLPPARPADRQPSSQTPTFPRTKGHSSSPQPGSKRRSKRQP